MVAATECWDSDDTNTDDSDSEWPAVELDTHRRDFADVCAICETGVNFRLKCDTCPAVLCVQETADDPTGCLEFRLREDTSVKCPRCLRQARETRTYVIRERHDMRGHNRHTQNPCLLISISGLARTPFIASIHETLRGHFWEKDIYRFIPMGLGNSRSDDVLGILPPNRRAKAEKRPKQSILHFIRGWGGSNVLVVLTAEVCKTTGKFRIDTQDGPKFMHIDELMQTVLGEDVLEQLAASGSVALKGVIMMGGSLALENEDARRHWDSLLTRGIFTFVLASTVLPSHDTAALIEPQLLTFVHEVFTTLPIQAAMKPLRWAVGHAGTHAVFAAANAFSGDNMFSRTGGVTIMQYLEDDSVWAGRIGSGMLKFAAFGFPLPKCNCGGDKVEARHVNDGLMRVRVEYCLQQFLIAVPEDRSPAWVWSP